MQVCELGEAGARRGRPLTLKPTQFSAASWMEKHDLASFNEKGRLLITSGALVFATMLSCPKRVADPEDPLDRSLWSLRRSLLAGGWTEGKSGKHASVEFKCFNAKSEHHAYFAILLQRNKVEILNLKLSVHFHQNQTNILPSLQGC